MTVVAPTEISQLPAALDRAPAIALGLSIHELRWVIGISLGFCIPTSCALLALADAALLGVGVGALVAAGLTVFTGRRLSALRRARPRGYAGLLVAAWLEDRGLRSPTLIRYSGVWAIRSQRGR